MDLYDNQKERHNHIKYRRRLDRTPDNNFKQLPENDKLRLNALRSALEETKTRIMSLRDENDVKDYIIDEERKLRKVTEENLNYLVDLYNNPDVNSELHQRLPRAKKVDLFHHEQQVITDNVEITNVLDDIDALRESDTTGYDVHVAEFSDRVETIVNMDTENSSASRRGVTMDNLSQPLAGAARGYPGVSYAPYGIPSHHLLTSGGDKSNMAETQFASRHPGESLSSSVLQATQNPQVWPTIMSISQLLPPYIDPNFYSNPLSPDSWSSVESSVYQGLPQVQGQKDHRAKEQKSNSQKNKTEQNLYSKGTQTTPEQHEAQNSFSFSEPALQFPTHSTSLPFLHARGSCPSQHSVHPVQYPLYSTHKCGPAQYGSDNVSHMSRLLVEMATLKKENEELKKLLGDARQEIELLNSNTKSTEERNLDTLGVLIEELHNAEKDRSIAMRKLMSVADKEKTETLEQVKHSKTKLTSKSVQTVAASDSEFSEAEGFEDGIGNPSDTSIGDSGGDSIKKSLQKQEYIEQLVARQREIMKEEMQKVLDERNDARQRLMKLEKKFAALELSHCTDNRNSALLAKLRLAERERDMVLARLKYLTRDVDETKLMYNLHKALLSDDPTNHTSSYHVPKTSNLDFDLAKKISKTSLVPKESEEQAQLEAKLALADKQKKFQDQRIEKLEQLVKRQRQKLNTLCAGPMLLEN